MDQEQFQLTARELLERHIAETNQPKQTTPEIGRVPESEPTRPEEHYGARYAQGVGDYVSETTAARQNDEMINREYRAHDRSAQKDLEQHIEKAAPEQTDRVSAREALEQHLEGAKSEVTGHQIDPFNRDRAHQLEYER
jgi:hypothetical protein